MSCASWTRPSRDAFGALAGALLVVTGCTNTTGPTPVSTGLWIANSGSSQSVVQYSTPQLAASTSVAPNMVIGTPAEHNLGAAFDSHGNLWIASLVADTIVEYSAAQLKSSGTPVPVVTLSVPGTNPAGLAFDAHGNLWVTNYGANTVVEYSTSQIASNGAPTPAVTIAASAGSLQEPVGIAFDASGNLWIANSLGDAATVVEFTTGQLTASGTPTPAITITSNAGSLFGPMLMAFDANGGLWVANGAFTTSNTVVGYSASQLAASGSPVPNVTLSAAAGSLFNPAGLAFDGSGNLWVSNFGVSNLGSSTVVEFAANQLTTGSPTPAVIMSSSSLVGPAGLAFEPKITGLPIK